MCFVRNRSVVIRFLLSILIVIAIPAVQSAPVHSLHSRNIVLKTRVKKAQIEQVKRIVYNTSEIKSVVAPTSSRTSTIDTIERPRISLTRISNTIPTIPRNRPSYVRKPAIPILPHHIDSLSSTTKGNIADTSSTSEDDEEDKEETEGTKTLNGPMIMKRRRRSKGVLFIVPRKRKLAPLPPGTIATNIPVLNTSLSIVRHTAFPNGELFCFIQGVCRLGNGRYMLPAWMKRHSDKIASCGMTNVLYVMHEGESRNLSDVKEDGTLRRVIHLRGFPRDNVNVSDEFRYMDILGGDPPRSEWKKLVEDLTPRILLADMFLRTDAYNTTTTRTCYKKNGAQCNTTDMYPPALNVSLLVDVGISAVKDHKWPKGVIRLLRNGFEGSLLVTDLADIYGFRFRNQASCFRSILTTNATLASFNATRAMAADNFMYRANAISREPVLNLAKMDGRRCDLKVLILDRVEQGKIYGLKTLQRAITMLNLRLSKRFPTASVQSEAVYFQNISFHEQISVMQEADIAVAAHSEVNANIPFLRPNASFFEILPFGLSPEYRTLADAYDVRYFHVNAMPDTDMFQRCIVHFNDGIDEERDFLLHTWSAEVSKNNARRKQNFTDDEHSFHLPGDGELESMGELRNIRKCAALQRVSANTKHLATAIFKVAMEKCGIHSETAHKQVFF